MERKKIDWNNVYEKMEKTETKGYQNELSESVFVPKLKDDGSFEAIIRFLPRPESDGIIPYVELKKHFFQDAGGWFVENCPTTLEKDCPVCKHNSALWKNGDEETVRKRSRRTEWYNNILIVTDPQNKENEGKVFIYKFGKKIFDMIKEITRPAKGSITTSVPIFDWEDGMNFKLIIKPKKTGSKTYNNYDSSSFTGHASPVGDNDYIDSIEKKLHNLGDIVAPSKFKEYKIIEQNFLTKIGESTISDDREEVVGSSTLNTKTNSDESFEKSVESVDENPETFFESLNN